MPPPEINSIETQQIEIIILPSIIEQPCIAVYSL